MTRFAGVDNRQTPMTERHSTCGIVNWRRRPNSFIVATAMLNCL
jgi:hypothetical protein